MQSIREVSTIERGDEPLGFVLELDPVGFVVVSGDTDLPPVIAYSLRDAFPSRQPEVGILLGILRLDLVGRLVGRSTLPAPRLDDRRREWLRLLGEVVDDGDERRFQQWPAAGTTSTGGWLETNWHQSSPYNDKCPLDPAAPGTTSWSMVTTPTCTST